MGKAGGDTGSEGTEKPGRDLLTRGWTSGELAMSSVDVGPKLGRQAGLVTRPELTSTVYQEGEMRSQEVTK